MLRQRNAVVSVVGLVILIGLIACCALFGDISGEIVPETVTVADKLLLIYEAAAPNDEFIESENVLTSYYGSLTEPLGGCLATFDICDNNDMIVFLSEYGSRVRLRIDAGYVYHGETGVFAIDEMTDGVLTLRPVRAEKIDDNAYRMVTEGDAETFVADMT